MNRSPARTTCHCLLVETSHGLSARGNLERPRALAAGHPELEIFCSHDPDEFEALSGTRVR